MRRRRSRISSSLVVTAVPSIAVIRSYGLSPARAPGVFSVTSYTSAPRAVPRLSDRCRSGSTSFSATPMNPRATRPYCFNCGRTARAWFTGHGEADVARPRADGRVDADHFAARVDERAAAVAEVDGGVGLDVVVEALVEQLPPDVAHDAHGHRVLVGQRVADGAHPLADAQRVGIAQRAPRETAVGDSTLISAMSVSGSDPTTRARSVRPSASFTMMRSARSITWWFVRMCPSGSMNDAAAGPAPRRVHVVRPRSPTDARSRCARSSRAPARRRSTWRRC